MSLKVSIASIISVLAMARVMTLTLYSKLQTRIWQFVSTNWIGMVMFEF